MIANEKKLDVAKAVLKELAYDRDKWRIVLQWAGLPNRAFVDMLVTTREPHVPTGLFSTASVILDDVAFESSETLIVEMRAAIERLITDIEALPPPTMELAGSLRG